MWGRKIKWEISKTNAKPGKFGFYLKNFKLNWNSMLKNGKWLDNSFAVRESLPCISLCTHIITVV
jgi:hypothetical protein